MQETGKKQYRPGDTVYAWSNEHYDTARLTECVIEEANGDSLLLYAVADNRSFYRTPADVMDRDELESNLVELGLK